MNVKDVMNEDPRAVHMVDRLDRAARLMWEQDCGFAPVVDGADVLVGVLTDRDLCMASYMQGKALDEVPVLAVMSRELTVARADDSLATAMQAMQDTQVHRLPVVDARGVLIGVLSTNDLVRAAAARPAAVDGKAVLQTLARIGASRRAGAEHVAPAAEVVTAAVADVADAAPAKPKRVRTASKTSSRKKKA